MIFVVLRQFLPSTYKVRGFLPYNVQFFGPITYPEIIRHILTLPESVLMINLDEAFLSKLVFQWLASHRKQTSFTVLLLTYLRTFLEMDRTFIIAKTNFQKLNIFSKIIRGHDPKHPLERCSWDPP